MGREISAGIKKDLTGRLARAEKIIFFLDYDGTLTPIRKKPPLAVISKNAKALLKKISREKWAKIFIISGRSLKNVKNLIGINSLHYSGNHGMELGGPSLKYTNPAAGKIKPRIDKCFRHLKKKLKIKGVILENKGYSLSVHYRLAAPEKIPGIRKILERTIWDFRADKKIKITEGKKVLELRPNIKWHKGMLLSWVLERVKGKFTLPIYIGDDITDEDAFRALGKRGLAILVSRARKKTAAHYRLNSPKEVLDFLKFIYTEKNQ